MGVEESITASCNVEQERARGAGWEVFLYCMYLSIGI